MTASEVHALELLLENVLARLGTIEALLFKKADTDTMLRLAADISQVRAEVNTLRTEKAVEQGVIQFKLDTRGKKMAAAGVAASFALILWDAVFPIMQSLLGQ